MRPHLSALLGVWLLVGLSPPAPAAGDYVQPQDQFIAAIDNHSTARSFILITAIDANTRQSRTGCIPAGFLLGAIIMERGLPRSDQSGVEARGVALSRPDHVYTFSKAEALANLGFDNDRRYAAACDIIRSGHPAFQADRTGAILRGQP
jgi:hypothetical protein